MRVLLIAPRFAPDDLGAAGHQAALLYSQARLVDDVALVCGYRRSRGLVPPEALGVDLCGRGPVSARMAIRRASRRRARTHHPDVVLTLDPSAPRCGRPAVALLPHLTADDRLPSRIARARLSAFRRVLVPSDPVARLLIEGGLPEATVRVAPPGIDAAAASERAIGDVIRLVCVGGIAPHKGQHLAIDAVARLSPVEKARVHLDLVGRVDDPVYVEQLKVQAWNQPVSFHLDVADTTPFFRNADLVVYPSLVEPAFPYGAVQGAAAGVPVAYSDRPGIRAALGNAGTPVAPGDADAWRAAVRRFIDGPAPIIAAARELRATVAARWTPAVAWTAVRRQLQDVL